MPRTTTRWKDLAQHAAALPVGPEPLHRPRQHRRGAAKLILSQVRPSFEEEPGDSRVSRDVHAHWKTFGHEREYTTMGSSGLSSGWAKADSTPECHARFPERSLGGRGGPCPQRYQLSTVRPGLLRQLDVGYPADRELPARHRPVSSGGLRASETRHRIRFPERSVVVNRSQVISVQLRKFRCLLDVLAICLPVGRGESVNETKVPGIAWSGFGSARRSSAVRSAGASCLCHRVSIQAKWSGSGFSIQNSTKPSNT